jgi:hypothetical protein
VWLEKWKTPSDIERQFSPIKWEYAMRNPQKAYDADCPTLASYDIVYGEKAAIDWIHIQILALFASSNCKDVGIADGIRLFAHSFAREAAPYKLSELMLFFGRYRAGRYDNSYASFDSKRIGNAFFFEFLKERSYEIDKVEREKKQIEIEKRKFTPPHGYTSLSWYQELKRRASNGDEEAIEVLDWNH